MNLKLFSWTTSTCFGFALGFFLFLLFYCLIFRFFLSIGFSLLLLNSLFLFWQKNVKNTMDFFNFLTIVFCFNFLKHVATFLVPLLSRLNENCSRKIYKKTKLHENIYLTIVSTIKHFVNKGFFERSTLFLFLLSFFLGTLFGLLFLLKFKIWQN